MISYFGQLQYPYTSQLTIHEDHEFRRIPLGYSGTVANVRYIFQATKNICNFSA